MEIAAWAQLSGVSPTPWEVSLLKRVDRIAVTHLNAKEKPADEPEFEADADDEVGVKSVFASLRDRSRAVFGKAESATPTSPP